jgi:signal transduction histidine kinase
MDTYAESIREFGLVSNYEILYRFRNGEIRTVLISGILVDWEGEECILSVSNDITELRQYEKELSRLDNLNLMGQMAGSIAHEVRNPMTSIKGFLQLFQHQYKYREDRESIDLMIEELDRVNEIITTFLSLSQVNHIQLKPMNLNDCIIGVLGLIIADAVKNDIFVDTKFKYLSEIMVDEGEIRQLLLNLSRNAIQAMPKGGKLTIEANHIDEGKAVQIIVADTGVGIPQRMQNNLFRPLFTTKSTGQGFGLVVVKKFVEALGGSISLESQEGKGTKFIIQLPSNQ